MTGNLAYLGFFCMLAGFFPLFMAWLALGKTTLRPCLGWALAAWATWTILSWEAAFRHTVDSPNLACLALGLTGSAGIAVLGARRPGLGAWNFVLVALLLLLLFPIARGLGRARLESHDFLLLIVTFGLLTFNYLPTRLAFMALAVAFACRAQMNARTGLGELTYSPPTVFLSLGAAPWLGWLGWRIGRGPRSEFDITWRDFRDRFGWFWAQRVREQFNRAAANAGWPVTLSWFGLQKKADAPEPCEAELLRTLQALLKRFGPPDSTA